MSNQPEEILDKNLLSIIIPAYNEASTITEILDRMKRIKLTLGIQKEIIIVNDCSSDNTEGLILDYQKKNPHYKIIYVCHARNKGKGGAVKSGIKYATGKYLLIQDADLEYDPKEYNSLLEPIVDDKADVVYGSRFIGGNLHRVTFYWYSARTKWLTKISNMLTNLNLTDMECGYKCFRTAIVKQLDLYENGFGFESEITAKISRIKRVRIYEQAVSYQGRTVADGKKLTWQDGFDSLWCILKYNLWKK
ncbi:MAG: glycosyltransferase involved in cell wall biosynthesis [Arenicella sp.]|jgi:glycosyltransferase involved in cell wall biosynthesis